MGVQGDQRKVSFSPSLLEGTEIAPFMGAVSDFSCMEPFMGAVSDFSCMEPFMGAVSDFSCMEQEVLRHQEQRTA
jgi:hypothetical protein